MSTLLVVLIIIAAIIILAAVGWTMYRKKRSRELRTRFGPEYDRAFRQYGESAKAEDALLARQRRMEKVSIRPLTDAERERFANSWNGIQSRFVDDPSGTIRQADQLVADVMVARGYPMSDFNRRAEDISVDHPHVVSNYRTAHEIAQADETGQASTEDLRKAVVCYRMLFDELLETHVAPGR